MKIFHILALDYDGALLPESGDRTVLDQNQPLLNAIRLQNKNFNACSTLLTSNRQSWDIDHLNSNNHPEHRPDRSCFKAIREISQVLEAPFCPMLMADAYWDRSDGYAYTRAISHGQDETAWHPGTIFDDNKTSLLYTQTHKAALLARKCDFLCIDINTNPDNLYMLPFNSNAAYLYFKDTQQCLYINRIEKIELLLEIKNQALFTKFLASYQTALENEDHDFEMIDQENRIFKGITLKESDLQNIEKFSQHRHKEVDYPIVFDFFDDNGEIIKTLFDTFSNKKQSKLLPSNLVLRFNLYDANHPNTINEPCAMIVGAGAIDLKPKKTVSEIAHRLANKKYFEDSDFIEFGADDVPFTQFFRNLTQNNSFFSQRACIHPEGVKISINLAYTAPIHLFSTKLDPEDICWLLAKIHGNKSMSIVSKFILFQNVNSETLILKELYRYARSNSVQRLLNYINQIFEYNSGDISKETIEFLNKIKDKNADAALSLARKPNSSNDLQRLLNVPDIEVSQQELGQGLDASNPTIAQSCQIKEIQPVFSRLKNELDNQTRRFEENSKSWLGFLGNAKKALQLKSAIARATDKQKTQVNVQAYLNTRVDGHESIMDILASHRIGFFGKTRSQETIEKLANAL